MNINEINEAFLDTYLEKIQNNNLFKWDTEYKKRSILLDEEAFAYYYGLGYIDELVEKQKAKNIHPLNYDLSCDYVSSNLAVNFYEDVPKYVSYEICERADISKETLYSMMSQEEPIDEENIKLSDILKLINKSRK